MLKWGKNVLQELIEIKTLLVLINKHLTTLSSTVHTDPYRGEPTIRTGHWND